MVSEIPAAGSSAAAGDPPTPVQNRFRLGVLRGLKRTCPQCGMGRLFDGYLKVQQGCAACGHDNGQYRADDGPAYFTILLVGHVIIAPLFAASIFGSWSPLWLLVIGLPLVAVATLALLPFVKGAWIGVLWASRGNGPADPGI